MKDAANALRWSVNEMERHKLMSALGVRNLAGYNERDRRSRAHGTSIRIRTGSGDSMDAVHPVLENRRTSWCWWMNSPI